MKFALDAGEDSISSNFLNNSVGKKLTSKVNKETGKNSCCPSLTLKQRIIGYAVCTILGNHKGTFYQCFNRICH